MSVGDFLLLKVSHLEFNSREGKKIKAEELILFFLEGAAGKRKKGCVKIVRRKTEQRLEGGDRSFVWPNKKRPAGLKEIGF